MKERLEQKKQELMERVGQALLEQLPVEQKTLRRAARYLEPRKVRRLALACVGGAVLISAAGTLAHDRVAQAATARELRKELSPIQEKLDALQAQNEELKRQNQELGKKLEELKRKGPDWPSL